MMSTTGPISELDPRFSSPGAAPRAWSEARARLDEAEIYWLSAVRPDGQPHVTTVPDRPVPLTGNRVRIRLAFVAARNIRAAHRSPVDT